MDWFLYDIGLRRERVNKAKLIHYFQRIIFLKKFTSLGLSFSIIPQGIHELSKNFLKMGDTYPPKLRKVLRIVFQDN